MSTTTLVAIAVLIVAGLVAGAVEELVKWRRRRSRFVPYRVEAVRPDDTDGPIWSNGIGPTDV